MNLNRFLLAIAITFIFAFPFLAYAGDDVEGNCGQGSGAGNAKCGADTSNGNSGGAGGAGGLGGAGGAGGAGGLGGQGGLGVGVGIGVGVGLGVSNATSGSTSSASNRTSVDNANQNTNRNANSNANSNANNNTVAGSTQQQNASADNANNASQQVNVGGSTYINQRSASSAIAPAFSTTTTCAVAGSVSVQGLSFGVSAGKSTIDENCAAIEAAKAIHQLGKTEVAHEVMCSLPQVRQARQRAQDPCAADRDSVEK